MLSAATCQYCGNKAQYYCTNCKKLLCADHVVISNAVYYCHNCEKEVYESVCPHCGSEAEYVRPDNVYLCAWCKTPTVVDGLVYHQQLPEKIFTSIAKINTKLADLLVPIEQYHKLIDTIWNIRIAKISLFPEIEDELSILRTKIDNFIGQLNKFIDSIFNKINKKLQYVHYFRSQNLNNLEPGEELITYIEQNYSLLENSMKQRLDKINEEFSLIQKKVNYLEYQYNILKEVYDLIPEEENEELISILPRIWIRKNGRLPTKHIFILTNKNIYLLREKGLFNVKLKLSETISLSRVRIKAIKDSLYYGSTFTFTTHMAKYILVGRNKTIKQLRNYFIICNDYFRYANNDLSIIKELKYYTLSAKDIRLNVNRQLNNLRVSLLKKREIKREILYRDSLEVRERQILEQLANIKRKIEGIIQNRPKNRFHSSKVIENLLQKLVNEQNRLIQELRANREEIRQIDESWGVYGPEVGY